MVFWKWWTTIVIIAVMAAILEYYIGASSFIWERENHTLIFLKFTMIMTPS